MRKPERIEPFLKTLETAWLQVSDWRFGQLMVNFLNSLEIDPFFIEDDEMKKMMIEYFELNESNKNE